MIRLFGQGKLTSQNIATHCKIRSSWFSTSHLTQQQCLNSPSFFDSHACALTLQDSIQNGDVDRALTLHCDILKRGGCLDVFAFNILLNLYVKSDSVCDARKLFDEMPVRNTVSFVTLMQGLRECNRFVEAMELFTRLRREGHELNGFVFTTTLGLLVRMEMAEIGLNLHCCIYKLGLDSDAFVGSALIDAYSVCGRFDMAQNVFEGIASRDMVCWTGIMSCFADNGCFQEAMRMFNRMRTAGFRPNNFTFASGLKACAGVGSLAAGESVHACVLKSRYEEHQFVALALVELYAELGSFDDALRVFEGTPKTDVVPWSFMITRCAQTARCNEAIEFFIGMRRASIDPNQFTCASLAQACATMRNLSMGKQIHCHALKAGLDTNVFVSNALMDVYAKCGKIEEAMDLFVRSPNKSSVTWNTVIVGYVQLGDGDQALRLFSSMIRLQVEATEVTFSSALCACASMSSYDLGAQIHSFAIKTMYDKGISVGNSLIDMYSKCGRIRDARLVFDRLIERDEVSWNVMISGYSFHSLGNEAILIFETMRRTECKPSKLTFVGVLSACSNAGMLDQGQAYFDCMMKEYNIEPCVEHYTCMVGLFGRLGQLDKAVRLIENVPFEPSVMVWRALLGACVVHNNMELGIMASQRVLEIDPHDDATHVLLSNLYANSKKWNDVAYVRKAMKRRGVKKEPGLSWVENQGMVHYFAVGDTDSHPDAKLIRSMLEWLNMKTRRAGFVPNCGAILRRMDDDDEKERHLWMHSERVALAFGLVRTSRGSPIRIIKNLRICVDCHEAMKFVSKIVKRDIVVRDLNRFHNFHDGVCSCGDCW